MTSLQFKCDSCKDNNNEFCMKLKEFLPNGFAKLYFGGIIDDEAHKGICASKPKPKNQEGSVKSSLDLFRCEISSDI